MFMVTASLCSFSRYSGGHGHEGKALIVFLGSGADYALTKSGSDCLEQMHADILMQYPGYDDCWPSDEAVPRMQKILKQCKYPYRVQATCYEKGSHLLGAVLPEDYRKQMRKILQAEAVDPAACEQAREESMREEPFSLRSCSGML